MGTGGGVGRCPCLLLEPELPPRPESVAIMIMDMLFEV